jgi:hypothetical protein
VATADFTVRSTGIECASRIDSSMTVSFRTFQSAIEEGAMAVDDAIPAYPTKRSRWTA